MSAAIDEAEAPARKRDRLAGLWASRLVFAAWWLLAFYWLFAHGCHGDEDNELFGVVGGVINQYAFR